MTKYYVYANGAYLGAYDGADPEVACIEVPFPPDDARQIWDFENSSWLPAPLTFKPIEPVPFWNAVFDLFGLKKSEVILAAGDEDAQYLAGLAIEGRKTYVRTDPFVADLATAKGYTPEEVDSLWLYIQENYV